MKRANTCAAILAILLVIAGYHFGSRLTAAVESYNEHATAQAIAEMR